MELTKVKATLIHRQFLSPSLAVVLTLAAGFYLVFGQAVAQQSRLIQGISVSPALVERDVQPGSTQSLSLKLSNQEETETTLFIATADFVGDPNEGGKPQFTENPGPNSLSTWVKLSEEKVTIGPGQSRDVKFDLTVPQGAEPGSHYGAIILSQEDPEKAPGTQVAATSQVGTLVFAKVAGEVVEKGKSLSFNTSKGMYDYPPVIFEVRFQNEGNVATKPTGLIEIFNSAGVKEDVIQINKEFGNVLPNTTRKFEEQWNPKKWLNVIPRIGQYRAEGILTYGLPSQTQKLGSVTFWLIPWTFLATVGGVILGIVLIVFFFLRVYTNMVISQHDRRRR
jgi:hypothetical protein